ncbi:anti-sigma factor domain-containing protein [Sinanaerobacter sp. ZZT-01]|uniref:anti-sigma-I factor RsgI family protein n=1 Tax=Sinanaerobacter sp. ZZT-01 TaxID=3111540 RepID=UPI002D779851|nr:hypothetical protein [Sinanaerobacter sp. ZZT-01]WRR94872.1 hypothetical protein U5921_07070 [Sinanaerobacter sp. ZZT-01]
MKAVVTEIKGSFAALLSDDGRMIKVKNKNYAIGQVIIMKETRLKVKHKLLPWAAAVFAVFAISGAGAYAYCSPYSYVSLDVNPSIEYTLNRFDRILDVKAMNDDGQDILEEMNFKNMENHTIEKAIAQTIKEISKNGYFDGSEEGGIVIATFGKNEKKSNKLADTLQETAQEAADEENGEIAVESSSVGLNRVKKARELGVTPGKLNLVEKLQASAENPDEVNLEDWLNQPVKEIMKEMKENRKASQRIDEEEDLQQEDPADETTSSSNTSNTNKTTITNAQQKTQTKAEVKAEQKTQKKAEQQKEVKASVQQKPQEKVEQKATEEVQANTQEKIQENEEKEVQQEIQKNVQEKEEKTSEQSGNNSKKMTEESLENEADAQQEQAAAEAERDSKNTGNSSSNYSSKSSNSKSKKN